MKLDRNRILIAGTGSGCGKTTVTTGILKCLLNRNYKAAAFKCGPDYIDPMFHRRITGAGTGNLDPYFSSEPMLRYLLQTGAEDCEISVIEGVMGYFDGIGFTSKASTFDLAKKLAAPVILVINGAGMGASAGAVLDGFLNYRPDFGYTKEDLCRNMSERIKDSSSIGGVVEVRKGKNSMTANIQNELIDDDCNDNSKVVVDNGSRKDPENMNSEMDDAGSENNLICGVIFNNMSEKLYKHAAEMAISRGIRPLGYLPRNSSIMLNSRHLGLVTANEVVDLQDKVEQIAEMLQQTVDIDGVIELAQAAPILEFDLPEAVKLAEETAEGSKFFQADSVLEVKSREEKKEGTCFKVNHVRKIKKYNADNWDNGDDGDNWDNGDKIKGGSEWENKDIRIKNGKLLESGLIRKNKENNDINVNKALNGNTRKKVKENAYIGREVFVNDEKRKIEKENERTSHLEIAVSDKRRKAKIAVASDEAFCFTYNENLKFLEKCGCEILFFSPIHDSKLPEGTAGIILSGGYPELHAKALSENKDMLEEIRQAFKKGFPVIAECGGFMYLHEKLEGDDGKSYSMAGVIRGRCYRTGSLRRFGYIELTAEKEGLLGPIGTSMRAHEFHYWDSSNNGSAFTAVRADGSRSWSCGIMSQNVYAGFPHLFFYESPEAAIRFVDRCRFWGRMGN